MNYLDEVPFKIPLGSLEEAREEVQLITAPEIYVLDYLTLLQETEYVFSLENWVLTGLQGGYPSNPRVSALRCPSDRLATCPPYWMMFSSPQESRLASRWSSDFWEPNPRPRSHSLNAEHLRSMNNRVKFAISDSDEDDGPSEGGRAAAARGPRAALQAPGLRDLRQGSSLDFLSPPSQCGLDKRRKHFKQSSLSMLDPPRVGSRRTQSPASQKRTLKPRPACPSPPSRLQSSRVSTIRHHKPTQPVRATLPNPLGSHTIVPDSSVELLSALSPEERAVLEAVTERGYPLRTAIIALQKTGPQSPEQILSYLVACERLCERGYDEALVEEALEMFQNCETKAEEFLHLLTQFNEMGFQQNAIKEVLLVHENHCERALEELMTRVF